MKKLLLLIICASFLSCKKESNTTSGTKCYHCTFGVYAGVRPEPVDYCGDDGGARRFKDAAGNDLSSQCLEK